MQEVQNRLNKVSQERIGLAAKLETVPESSGNEQNQAEDEVSEE